MRDFKYISIQIHQKLKHDDNHLVYIITQRNHNQLVSILYAHHQHQQHQQRQQRQLYLH